MRRKKPTQDEQLCSFLGCNDRFEVFSLVIHSDTAILQHPNGAEACSLLCEHISAMVGLESIFRFAHRLLREYGLDKELINIKDVLIVAGDVAETYNNFVSTMSLLKDRFEHVFYVPGNHDVWCRRESENYEGSLEKLDCLLDACRRLGVTINPTIINDLGIIPLYSWYHESFDREDEITSFRIPPLEMVIHSLLLACKDYHACKWPEELSKKDEALAAFFDSMNESNNNTIEEIRRECSQIITFSHFVPRQELCPEKRMLFYPNLPKIIGSDCLEARIRSIHGLEGGPSACHVFGHTHFCWDAVLDGIRYVQAPLAYPRGQKRRMNGGGSWLPFCIYSDGEFSDRLYPCYWSDYYSINAREPHNTDLAPWVARFYSRRLTTN